MANSEEEVVGEIQQALHHLIECFNMMTVINYDLVLSILEADTGGSKTVGTTKKVFKLAKDIIETFDDRFKEIARETHDRLNEEVQKKGYIT